MRVVEVAPFKRHMATAIATFCHSGSTIRSRAARLSAERLDDTVATASSGAVNRTDIISLALVFFTLFMLDISTAVAMPNLSTMFAVLGQDDTSTAAYIASIGFVGALFEFLTLPMIAGLSEDVGRRKLIIGIPALCVALSLLAFMVPSVWTLCMWRLLITAVTGWYATMVSIYIADCFADDEIEVASYEGKLQAAMGAADSLGFLIGGYLEGWYTVTAVTLGASLLALVASFGTIETLAPVKRIPFRILNPSNSPAACLQLFRAGRVIWLLSAVLGLQAVHNEGGIWPLLAKEKRNWGQQEIALYGSVYGVVATLSGLVTGNFVRILGPKMFTIFGTACAAASLLAFTSTSNVVASSALFWVSISNSCSVAVIARILQLGSLRGISTGALTSAMQSLCAVMRVVGIGLFGQLYTYGTGFSYPELPYVVFSLIQLATVALVFPIHWDREAQEAKQR